ncbi:MAG: quinone-interacting membrane-bound oxidoreductase complex subunit QmoC [Firmicutes bacterium]|nr:quinone-interacting membrane-bound oxidoreductase complex subunit QmoC [Bacillota bacterium]
MSEQQYLVEPDLQFIKDIQAAGGGDLKKCFQCATCSVVCNVTPEDSPFPRKEMIWAQWGQKEKLMSDPDVWLCHQCNDCTANCPRGAKPGDVFAAIRNMAVRSYAFPSFMGNLLGKPSLAIFAWAIPVLILLIVISLIPTIYSILPHNLDPNSTLGGMIHELQHSGWSNMPADKPIRYGNFYPEMAIDMTFITLAALGLISLFVGILRMWRSMVKNHGEQGLMGAPVPNLLKAIPTIFRHKKFMECDESKNRYYGHLGVFYGFVGAFVTTAFVSIGFYAFGISTPYAQFSHVKLFGNLSAAAIIIGGIVLWVQRATYKKSASSYFDWTLIVLVTGLGVTGLATELVRLADLRAIAYPTYFIHLVFVAYLFLYLPFSKMAHLAYRSVAMAFARQAQRDLVFEDEIA